MCALGTLRNGDGEQGLDTGLTREARGPGQTEVREPGGQSRPGGVGRWTGLGRTVCHLQLLVATIVVLTWLCHTRRAEFGVGVGLCVQDTGPVEIEDLPRVKGWTRGGFGGSLSEALAGWRLGTCHMHERLDPGGGAFPVGDIGQVVLRKGTPGAALATSSELILIAEWTARESGWR